MSPNTWPVKAEQKWEPEIYTLCYDVIIYTIHHDMSVDLRFTILNHPCMAAISNDLIGCRIYIIVVVIITTLLTFA